MPLCTTLISLFACAGLLLVGTHLMGASAEAVLGADLHATFGYAPRTRLLPFIVGFCAATLVQSGTVVGLMATRSTSRGVLGLVPALALMLGANVGSTMMLQVLSLDVATCTPFVLIAGALALTHPFSETAHNAGRALLGLGLVFVALQETGTTLAAVDEAPAFQHGLGALASSPLIAMLSAGVITWLAHSSAAIVLIIAGLANKGVLPPDAAFAMVLGANVGTSLNPLIEATDWADPASCRLPLGNLLVRGAGALVALTAISEIGHDVIRMAPKLADAAVDLNTAFNLAVGLLTLPFLNPIARVLEALLPATKPGNDVGSGAPVGSRDPERRIEPAFIPSAGPRPQGSGLDGLVL